MFAGARISVALTAVALISACDLSQKKPETIATTVAAKRVAQSAAVGGVDTPAPPAEGASAEGNHDRSVRLYGPGVNRQRQTRI